MGAPRGEPVSDPGPDSGSESVTLRTDTDVILARQRVREAAIAIGLDLVAQTKIVTASSELSRNTVLHGGGGEVTIARLALNGAPDAGLRLTFTDQGPGIRDIDLAMTGGWTSGKGLGLGLPGSRRLVHDFEITSAPGEGTAIVITMWRRR